MSTNIYRSLVYRGKGVLDKYKARIREIEREGRTNEWELRAKNEAKKAYKAELKAVTDAMYDERLAARLEAGREAENLRRRPANPLRKDDTAEKLFHQNAAQQFFEGLEGEEALKAYKELHLHEEDRPFKFIYEDALKAKARGEDLRFALEDALDTKRTPEEKEALGQVRAAEIWQQHHKTLAGLLHSELEELSHGEEPAKTNFDAVLDDMEGNVASQVSPKED